MNNESVVGIVVDQHLNPSLDPTQSFSAQLIIPISQL